MKKQQSNRKESQRKRRGDRVALALLFGVVVAVAFAHKRFGWVDVVVASVFALLALSNLFRLFVRADGALDASRSLKHRSRKRRR